MSLEKFPGGVIPLGDHALDPREAPIRVAKALPRLKRVGHDVIAPNAIGNSTEDVGPLPPFGHEPVLP